MGRYFIVTVGTSLIDNYLNSKGKIRTFDREEIEDSTCDEDIWEKGSNLDSLHEEIYKSNKVTYQINNYKLAYDEISEWLNGCQNRIKELEEKSAELKTLFKLSTSFGDSDKIYLLPTFTYGGILCAKLLEDTIKEIPNSKAGIETIFTKGLNSAKDTAFVTEGIPNLLDNIYNKVLEGESNNKEVYLLISGGYKSIVPYATLVGLLTHHKLYYIYEKSDELIELPELPIDIDMRVFRPNYNIIRNIEVTDEDVAHFDALDDRLKSLFDNINGKLIPKKILKFLIANYLNSVSRSNLTLQAGNMSVLKYLRSSDESLYKKFINLNDVGFLLWIGDKIPEMVDHALKHHDNLFALTDLILAPILNNESNCKEKTFISAEELFVLLCTIYFHDFGHSISYFPSCPKRKLLASEIREYHHVLGYERLTKHKETLAILTKILNWIDKNGKDNKTIEKYIEEYFNAIATLGLYHRKVMPLEEQDPDFSFTIGNTQFKFSVPSKEVTINGKVIGTNRLLFLIAIFRVIDSLDNQFARVGEKNEFIFKMLSLVNDVREELIRVNGIGNLVGNCRSEIDDLFNKIDGNYEKNPLNIDEDVKNLAENRRTDQNLIWIYLDAKSRAFMKMNQFKHYLKHLFLDVPYFDYKFEDGVHKIKVIIRKNKNFDEYVKALQEIIKPLENDNEVIKKLEEVIDIYINPNCSKIFEDIQSDYEKVKKILKDNCLVFEFENELCPGKNKDYKVNS
ncbi:MAG: putative CRISPR-associated protein [archaeon]